MNALIAAVFFLALIASVTARPPSPRDCAYSWSAWSSCDCSSGLRSRVITITTTPKWGGQPCPSSPQQEACTCEPTADCDWEWAPWGDCDCSTNQRTRQVIVNSPATGNGAPCPESQTGPCESGACGDCKPCIVEWTPWTCSSRCAAEGAHLAPYMYRMGTVVQEPTCGATCPNLHQIGGACGSSLPACENCMCQSPPPPPVQPGDCPASGSCPGKGQNRQDCCYGGCIPRGTTCTPPAPSAKRNLGFCLDNGAAPNFNPSGGFPDTGCADPCDMPYVFTGSLEVQCVSQYMAQNLYFMPHYKANVRIYNGVAVDCTYAGSNKDCSSPQCTFTNCMAGTCRPVGCSNKKRMPLLKMAREHRLPADH